MASILFDLLNDSEKCELADLAADCAFDGNGPVDIKQLPPLLDRIEDLLVEKLPDLMTKAANDDDPNG